MKAWTPASWQSHTAGQQPLYDDAAAVERAIATLNRMPPLVTWAEVNALRSRLADAQRGEHFLLQGGDCAESFEECTSEFISNKLRILLQMSLVLGHGMDKPVVRVGRIAGQYAKPRSADTETRGGVTLPSYRGDLINRLPFTPEARRPDPDLMLRGYERAALTLNYVRALVEGGFADLHHPEYWNLSFVTGSPLAERYRAVMHAVSAALNRNADRDTEFYTSHEGLHLPYEQAQTHYVEEADGWYNQATHFPWIGKRTADPAGAHVEYFRGIANPVAVKVGADMSADVIKRLVDTLNPNNEPGRLTLIHRYGASVVEAALPRLIDAVRATGRDVLFVSDPMHGNTEMTAKGVKTRRFENILRELDVSFRIHEAMGSQLGGVHVELTGENVTECIGGARGLDEADLHRAYRSTVDPRLNYEQALELAMRIAAQHRPPHSA